MKENLAQPPREDPGPAGSPGGEPEGISRRRAPSHDVVVVGGGVIGLSIAWKAASAGMNVGVVDPDPGRGSSWAAAGMLAPVTEVHYGEETLLALNLAACSRWPAFADELEAASGSSVGFRRCGTLLVALEDADRTWLEELYDFEKGLGLEVEWLNGRGARAIEPNLSPNVRAGMRAVGDHQVDNRRLIEALLAATRMAGCTLHRTKATSVLTTGGTVEGVQLEGEALVGARNVVLAAGAWSSDLGGIPKSAIPPVRPVKGQILRLQTPPGPPLLDRSVRGIVNGRAVYLVPRASGTVVLGATVEEQGFDTSVTAGAVYEMLRDAQRVVPGVSELQIYEVIAGLRPGSPDNGPIVGPAGAPDISGLLVATGHFRNGVLLAPLTAEAITSLLKGAEVPPEVLPFSPERFEMPSWSG